MNKEIIISRDLLEDLLEDEIELYNIYFSEYYKRNDLLEYYQKNINKIKKLLA